MPRTSVLRSLARPLLTAAFCAAVCVSASAAEIDEQRDLFRAVFARVELGDWSAVTKLSDDEQEMLEGYLLWPDLEATYLRATIRNADERAMETFLDRHGMLKPARELRYRYALDLARRGKMDKYFEIYEAFYQGLGEPKLDCLALQAELAAGRERQVANRARELWLVGKSQVKECDSVFEELADSNVLGSRDFLDRYTLAIEAREFSLARWLAPSIDVAHVEKANTWLAAQSNPEAFLQDKDQRSSTIESRQQMAYAIEQLTYADPISAVKLWNDVREIFGFSEEQKIRIDRNIALWTARDRLPGAYEILASLPAAARNDEVMRWRARTSLRKQEWALLLSDVNLMSDEEKSAEKWRYWRAFALQQNGQASTARDEFESLAQERSYYGFLAADELGLPYALSISVRDVDEGLIAVMAARFDLVRARELFLVGLDGRGRSEWDAVVAYFSPREKTQAAILADRWGWHSRAISTVASVGQYDDLSLRYPLPYQSDFTRLAAAASIAAPWAYGVARSESLFMRDIRSSAGAIGLMQLMPETGRKVAREIKLPYSGLDTLTNPQANIRLGTRYLANMAERYGGNRVLATAAYNAGPHRVDRWMPEEGSIDARIWIENIPFNETRRYVRRVLAAETIFHWRLTGDMQRLSDQLPVVEALPDSQRVASQQ